MVVPVSAEALDRARRMLGVYPSLMARDALHAAVVLHEGFEGFCSYDRDVDVIEGLTRTEP